jgi:hypothetical protein
MKKFEINQVDGKTVITNQSNGFKIIVEKGRTLKGEEYGLLVEVIQYKDNKTFEPVANYVFEGVGVSEDYIPTDDYRENFFAAINLFLESVAKTSNYLMTIPEYSTFNNEGYGFLSESHLGPELTEENCTPELWEELTGDETKDIPDETLPF